MQPSNEAQQIYASFAISQTTEAVPKSVEQERQDWENGVAEANQKLEATIIPVRPDGTEITAEWVRSPKNTTSDKGIILYFHGGGFNAGSCRTHRVLAAHLTETTQLPVLLFDYSLAPEKPFPAGLEDALQVYRWLLATQPTDLPIFFGGDSAGAGLALSTLVAARDANLALPKAAFLISPWVDLAVSGSSVQTLATVERLVSEKSLLHAAGLYLGTTDSRHPLASPLYADLTGLPHLLIQVGSYEILLSDSQRLAEKARQAGVSVQLEVWQGLWHVWPGWVGSLPEANAALAQIGLFLSPYTDRPA